ALAVPAVVTAASGKLFRKGVLIKDGTALERLAEVDTVVYDKTGTLTLGEPEALGLVDYPREQLEIVAALAGASSHPLSRALALALEAEGIRPAAVGDLVEVPGSGVEGRLAGERVRLGRAEWLGAEPGQRTATWFSRAGRPAVEFAFADRPRPGAAEAVRGLIAGGKRVILLSGDNEVPVATLAGTLGIPEWRSAMRPEEKAARIAELTAEGRRVLMVGDGLNDTAALAGAHVSISPASALDAARTASDIVLLGQDLAPLADAVRMAVVSRR